MLKEELIQKATSFTNSSVLNTVSSAIALSPKVVDLKLLDPPLISIADAKDPLFAELKKPHIVGPHFQLPDFWLPDAKSVVCIFSPYSKQIKQSNTKNSTWPSTEWLHGRIDGEILQKELANHLINWIQSRGFSCVIPRFSSKYSIKRQAEDHLPRFVSSWSERHVAYVAGMGTFGLTRALITEKGAAGTLLSFVTNLLIKPDHRPYTKHDEYCILCGACISRCPCKAISFQKGKLYDPCAGFLNKTKTNPPYYGCGKCYTGVPCESKIPKRRKK